MPDMPIRPSPALDTTGPPRPSVVVSITSAPYPRDGRGRDPGLMAPGGWSGGGWPPDGWSCGAGPAAAGRVGGRDFDCSGVVFAGQARDAAYGRARAMAHYAVIR